MYNLIWFDQVLMWLEEGQFDKFAQKEFVETKDE